MAAFAAIMLFASTQVPESNEAPIAHAGDAAPVVAALTDGSPADAGGSSTAPARRGGLNFSLFLFGR